MFNLFFMRNYYVLLTADTPWSTLHRLAVMQPAAGRTRIDLNNSPTMQFNLWFQSFDAAGSIAIALC